MDKIRDVIGSGGKVVRGIQEETGAQINIEEDGTIHIAAIEGPAGEAAKAMILGIVKEPEVGEQFDGEVVGIKDFGAFVKLTPGKDGLLHISRVANGRVASVEDVLTLGDVVKVEVLEPHAAPPPRGLANNGEAAGTRPPSFFRAVSKAPERRDRDRERRDRGTVLLSCRCCGTREPSPCPAPLSCGPGYCGTREPSPCPALLSRLPLSRREPHASRRRWRWLADPPRHLPPSNRPAGTVRAEAAAPAHPANLRG